MGYLIGDYLTGMSTRHLGSQSMLNGCRRRSFRDHCPCIRGRGFLRQGNQIYLEVWCNFLRSFVERSKSAKISVVNPKGSLSLLSVLPFNILEVHILSLSFSCRHKLTILAITKYRPGLYVVYYYILCVNTDKKLPPNSRLYHPASASSRVPKHVSLL